MSKFIRNVKPGNPQPVHLGQKDVNLQMLATLLASFQLLHLISSYKIPRESCCGTTRDPLIEACECTEAAHAQCGTFKITLKVKLEF